MVEGIFLGFLAYLSIVMSWLSLPLWLRRWFLRHPFVSDTVTGFSTWLFITAISKSLVAVIASFVAALLVNFSIYGYNWSKGEH